MYNQCNIRLCHLSFTTWVLIHNVTCDTKSMLACLLLFVLLQPVLAFYLLSTISVSNLFVITIVGVLFVKCLWRPLLVFYVSLVLHNHRYRSICHLSFTIIVSVFFCYMSFYNMCKRSICDMSFRTTVSVLCVTCSSQPLLAFCVPLAIYSKPVAAFNLPRVFYNYVSVQFVTCPWYPVLASNSSFVLYNQC